MTTNSKKYTRANSYQQKDYVEQHVEKQSQKLQKFKPGSLAKLSTKTDK